MSWSHGNCCPCSREGKQCPAEDAPTSTTPPASKEDQLKETMNRKERRTVEKYVRKGFTEAEAIRRTLV